MYSSNPTTDENATTPNDQVVPSTANSANENTDESKATPLLGAKTSNATVTSLAAAPVEDDENVSDKADITYREFLEFISGIATFVLRTPYQTHPDKVDAFIEHYLMSKPLPKYHVRQT